MKKIPTLFTRIYEGHKIVGIKDEITPGCEDAFKNGIATIKVDGSCCAIINGNFYKRYDAKKGRKPPEGAIPCCDHDPVTGHWPHWVPVDSNNPGDKWFIQAKANSAMIIREQATDWTYEAIGPHFQGNPYNLEREIISCRMENLLSKLDETLSLFPIGLMSIRKKVLCSGLTVNLSVRLREAILVTNGR